MNNKILSIIVFFQLAGWLSGIQAQDPLKVEKLREIVGQVQTNLAPDKRTAICEISIQASSDGSFVLTGKSSLKALKINLQAKLQEAGITWKDSIRLLPDPGVAPFALVRLSVANLRSVPAHSAELATQALLGTPLLILEVNDEWYHVQTPDNYIAWVDQGGISLLKAPEFERWKVSSRLVFLDNYGFVYREANLSSPVVSDLVAGDILEYSGLDKGFYKVRFPDGRSGFIPISQCRDFNQWLSQPDPRPADLINTALRFTGLPYLWGGTSVKGVDCSGFTKSCWFLNGIIIQRDASQQVLYGTDIPLKDAGTSVQPGDLLFFGTRGMNNARDRITHVAMVVDRTNYIHASGFVRLASMPATFNSSLAQGTFGILRIRRYAGAIGENGIIRVSQHPLYTNQKQ
jgi:gamma-D-glutamyl-L-lysine dipeptidyl-peptidase